MPDWPQPNPPPYPADDEDKTTPPEAYLDVRPDLVLDDFNPSDSQPLTTRAGWTEPGHHTHGTVTPDTHPGLFSAIAQAFGPPPVAPPDVWEFYREHGHWPGQEEA
jgi:hypothetical protein